MESYPDTFAELPLTGVLPSRDSKIKGAIVILAKTNAITLKRPVNKLFPIENTYQKITKRLWQAVIGKLKRKYEC